MNIWVLENKGGGGRVKARERGPGEGNEGGKAKGQIERGGVGRGRGGRARRGKTKGHRGQGRKRGAHTWDSLKGPGHASNV